MNLGILNCLLINHYKGGVVLPGLVGMFAAHFINQLTYRLQPIMLFSMHVLATSLTNLATDVFLVERNTRWDNKDIVRYDIEALDNIIYIYI